MAVGRVLQGPRKGGRELLMHSAWECDLGHGCGRPGNLGTEGSTALPVKATGEGGLAWRAGTQVTETQVFI